MLPWGRVRGFAAAVLVVTAPLAACYDASRPASCVLSCDTATACPSGLSCVSGTCVGTGESCSGPVDAALDDGADATDASTDAMPDAGFSVADCPATYTVQIALTSATSRYRLITTADTYYHHADACESDSNGLTHLVVAPNLTELTQLEAVSSTLGDFYIGAIQDPSASSVSAGWIWVTGTGMTGPWRAGYPNDNGDNSETDREAQTVVYLAGFNAPIDNAGTTLNAAICECDGMQVTAMAHVYITNDPVNPN